MQSKIMYIELKEDGLQGTGRIGRIQFSKSGKTLYYGNRTFRPTKGVPLKANFYDVDTFEDFWISGARKDGCDSLFPSQIEIDEEVGISYWEQIRNQPTQISKKSYRSPSRSKTEREKLEKGLRRRQMDNGWMPA